MALFPNSFVVPFELARALVTYGFNVPYIFSAHAGKDDQEHIAWLMDKRPETRVFQNIHPGIENFLEQKLKVDLTIGLDGEFFCPGTRTIQSIARQPYGYEGAASLLQEMATVMNNPHLYRPQSYAGNFMSWQEAMDLAYKDQKSRKAADINIMQIKMAGKGG